MNRLRLFATAALLAVPVINACGDDVVPPAPTGSISGRVTIEAEGIDGITVTLSGGATATTAGGGTYRFDNVEAGDHTITITGFPQGSRFNTASAPAELSEDGEVVTVDFKGTWIRTSGIAGAITVEGDGLGGVTVTVSGPSESEIPTGADGRYAFSGLRAGDYAIEISGFDAGEVTFGSTSSSATVAVDESKVVNFEGTYVRTSAIVGQVSVEGNPLAGVTVSLQGRGDNRTDTTDDAGQYMFEDLRSGEYSVAISGFDTDEYGFQATSKAIAVASGETAGVPFEGTALRTAGIMGRVTIEGAALEGVTVSLSGEGEDKSVVTGATGRYAFDRLHAGEYSVAISGFDTDEYGFDATSRSVTVELKETATATFDGIRLRTAEIMGRVSVAGSGLEGVTVELAGEEDRSGTTGEDGRFSFAGLAAGGYALSVSGYDEDEYEFDAGPEITLALGESRRADLTGRSLRTAGVTGAVMAEGEGIARVSVTLVKVAGADASEVLGTVRTGADGGYAFDELIAGTYRVEVGDFDDEYDFGATYWTGAVATDETARVDFNATIIRTASVGGSVSVDDEGLTGVTVTLTGDHAPGDRAVETDSDGGYAFDGLRKGSYTVTITNPDEDLYGFPATRRSVILSVGQVRDDVSFTGEMLRKASLGGRVHVEGVGLEGVTVVLSGGADAEAITDGNGEYDFPALAGGDYSVEISGWDDDAYEFETTRLNVDLDVAEAGIADFRGEHRIIRQTILVGASMGDASRIGEPVGDVRLALYPTAGDAEKDTNRLGTATTAASGDEAGFATFEFARADDGDRRVFARLMATGHADLAASDDELIEIAYEATDRATRVPAAVRLLNTRVNFQWSVRSDADAKDGNRFLPGWLATNGIATDGDGRAAYSGSVDVSDLPATFTVALDVHADQPDLGERWVQSGELTYVHDGLTHPALNTAARNDLGPIRVTWTTQALVVGVYREADDAPGYTDYQSGLPGGDHRPVASVGEAMTVELLERDGDSRLRRYTWDHDGNPHTEKKEGYSTVGPDGLVRFAGIPAGDEITVRFDEGDDRVLVTELENVETFGGDLGIGATAGAFGALSGGGPEVRICTASEETGDDECATFGYQWTTGAVSGNVGGASGHQVVLAPATDRHGAPGDTTESGGNGAYGFTGLQDGEYAITASATAAYKVDGETTRPVRVHHDERADAAGTDVVRWTTTRIGLKIMGYIGNDADGDKLMRGDEALAGVSVRLTRGPETVATAETDDRGIYVFEDLEEGRYAVRASSGSDYIVLRGFDPDTDAPIAMAAATSDEYPVLRDGKYRLPSWDYESNSANYTSVKVRKPGSTAQATLVNFALVYTDGALSGEVSNVSGSAADIDLRIRRERDDEVTEVTTGSLGLFAADELVEGSYRVDLADARFAAPCLTAAGGTPDDDGPDADGDGVCDHLAPMEIDADLRGSQAHAELPALQVYDIKLSADDSLGIPPGIEARMQGRYARDYNDTVTWTPGWTRLPGSEETRNDNRIGTISWASKSVTFSFPDSGSVPGGAGVVVMKDTTICANHTCELDFNGTGRTGTPGTSSRETTLTVTVTAENGYDDHIYSVVVGRADPVDNELLSDRVRRHNADDTTYTAAGGYGTQDEPFTLETDSAEAGSLRLHVDLAHLGVPGDNAACAQSLIVKTIPKAKGATGKEIKAGADAEGDICEDERYTLSVAEKGSSYTLHVFSEDGVEKIHHLELNRGPES